MKTRAAWIALAVIACLQAKTSFHLADRIAGHLAGGLSALQLEAAAQAIPTPARMVWRDADERKTAPHDAVFTRVVLVREPDLAHPTNLSVLD